MYKKEDKSLGHITYKEKTLRTATWTPNHTTIPTQLQMVLKNLDHNN